MSSINEQEVKEICKYLKENSLLSIAQKKEWIVNFLTVKSGWLEEFAEDWVNENIELLLEEAKSFPEEEKSKQQSHPLNWAILVGLISAFFLLLGAYIYYSPEKEKKNTIPAISTSSSVIVEKLATSSVFVEKPMISTVPFTSSIVSETSTTTTSVKVEKKAPKPKEFNPWAGCKDPNVTLPKGWR